MTPSRAEDRKSTKTNPKRPPRRKTAVSDIRIERWPGTGGSLPSSAPKGSTRRDDEFHQRGAAPAELVHFLHGGCGDGPVRKSARASRGAARSIDRAH